MLPLSDYAPTLRPLSDQQIQSSARSILELVRAVVHSPFLHQAPHRRVPAERRDGQGQGSEAGSGPVSQEGEPRLPPSDTGPQGLVRKLDL